MMNYSERSSDFGIHVAMFAAMLCGLTLLTGCDPGQLCSIAPELCNPSSSSCPFRNDNECDDGRPGSVTDLCDFGTDPEDCGDGSPNTGGSDGLDVTGTWRINETDSSDCGGDGSTTGTWNVTQTGSSVTVRSGSITLSGTLLRNTLNLQGSFPEDGGTTTVTRSNLTVGPTGNTISGTETWAWSDGFDSCSGTTTISGNRI